MTSGGNSYEIEQKLREKVFEGHLYRFSHLSPTLGNCVMHFHVYLPPNVTNNEKAPIIYFLSGLTSTDENFTIKSGAFKYLAKHGLALVVCDTSPRGDNVPDIEEEWDFGKGAGYYLDATQSPWNKHYHMYSYVVRELPLVLKQLMQQRTEFNVLDLSRNSLIGHSMGGHGALTIFLKNRDKYRSVSCFAPISNLAHPECSLGQKALSRYLGTDNKESWSQYSAVDLLNQLEGKGQDIEIYVDQGTEDVYWKELRIDDLKQACAQNNVKLTLNMREGYSHGYWFIQTFIEDHIQYHAKRLLK